MAPRAKPGAEYGDTRERRASAGAPLHQGLEPVREPPCVVYPLLDDFERPRSNRDMDPPPSDGETSTTRRPPDVVTSDPLLTSEEALASVLHGSLDDGLIGQVAHHGAVCLEQLTPTGAEMRMSLTAAISLHCVSVPRGKSGDLDTSHARHG